MRIKYILIGIAVGVLLSSVAMVLAGDHPAGPGTAPADTESYTLEDIYKRLDDGTAGAKSAWSEPDAAPGSTGHTLNDVMAKAPVTHTNGATPTHVLAGKPFWGLHSSAWATQTGAMPDNGAVTLTPTTTQQTIAEGYHDGLGYVEGDTDLTAGNIRSGANIFGVAGDPDVVDTSSGDAAAGDILSDKKAWVDGSEVTGERYGGCTCTGTLNGTRWCDNGDGTVTDLLGYNGKGKCLVWLKDASWGGRKAWRCESSFSWCSDVWDDAHTRASSYGGEYRLPTLSELYGLTDGTEPVLSGTPRAFTGVQSGLYWSSSTYADGTSYAWTVYLYDGGVYLNGKTNDNYVWPVRGGQ